MKLRSLTYTVNFDNGEDYTAALETRATLPATLRQQIEADVTDRIDHDADFDGASITSIEWDFDSAGRRYEVQTRIGSTWSNVFTEGREPLTFETRADAQSEIDELLYDTREAAARGDMSAPYRKSDYRVRVSR